MTSLKELALRDDWPDAMKTVMVTSLSPLHELVGRGAFQNKARDETAVDGPSLARASRARGAGCLRLWSCRMSPVGD
jgi:hypothetical protein